MDSSTWDTLFNLTAFLFWYRLWSDRQAGDGASPYLRPVDRMSTALVGFLRPVFLGTPAWIVTAAALVFVLGFKVLVVPDAAGWVLRIGIARQAGGGARDYLVFSAVSFGVFLFRLWGLAAIYLWTARSPFSGGPARETLHGLARPFSRLPAALAAPALLAFGMGLAGATGLAGNPSVTPAASTFPVAILKLGILGLAEWVNVLITLHRLLIVLVVASWISIFATSRTLNLFCHEWLRFLLGPLARRPVRIGTLDLSPWLMILLVGLAHRLLSEILLGAYQSLP